MREWAQVSFVAESSLKPKMEHTAMPFFFFFFSSFFSFFFLLLLLPLVFPLLLLPPLPLLKPVSSSWLSSSWCWWRWW